MQLLDRVGLAGDAHTRVGKFSKGMQMRLVFVRALLHRPELLFLDEPTTGMGPGNARTIKDIISELRDEGHTIFLTTHDMNVAEAAPVVRPAVTDSIGMGAIHRRWDFPQAAVRALQVGADAVLATDGNQARRMRDRIGRHRPASTKRG